MQRIVLGIEYQGTAYCGYQFQDHCDSVQKHLQLALSAIANEQIAIHCAGRTDTGVHAIGQVVHFDTQAIRPERAWVQGVNTHLPGDIRVVWMREVPFHSDFHARFSAIARQYRYVIFNRKVNSAILHKRVTLETKRLDEQAMHQQAQALLGEHDFSSFRAASCQASHARRELQKIAVSRRGDFVLIDVQANAFLHHMVRNLVGSLMQVGRGEKSDGYMKHLLDLQDRTQAGMTAPADGLYFVNAIYPSQWQLPLVPLNELLWG